MGSDLSMSPPTPDEKRLVRAGDYTGIYFRHTDGIYREGTDTWFRKSSRYDPDRTSYDTIRELHPGWKTVTLPEDETLQPQYPKERLSTPDRDYEAEIKELRQKAIRAREKATLAYEDAVLFEAKALALEKEAHDER